MRRRAALAMLGVVGTAGCLRLQRGGDTTEGDDGGDGATATRGPDSGDGGESPSGTDGSDGDQDTETPGDGTATEEFHLSVESAWTTDQLGFTVRGSNGRFFSGVSRLIGIDPDGEVVLETDDLGPEEYTLSLDSGWRNAFHADDSGVYVGSRHWDRERGGQVHRIDPDTGTVEWSSAEPDDGLHHEIHALTKTETLVIYAGQSGGSGEDQRPIVRAVDVESGARQWHIDFESGFVVALATHSGRLFVQRTSGLDVYDLSTRDRVTELDDFDGGFAPMERSGDVLYTPGETVRARELPSTDETWAQDVPGGVNTGAGLGDVVAAFGAETGFVYGFDRETGDQLWEARVDGVVGHHPIVRDGVVWIADESGGLSAFHERSGQLLHEERVTDEEFSLAVQADVLLDSKRTTAYRIQYG